MKTINLLKLKPFRGLRAAATKVELKIKLFHGLMALADQLRGRTFAFKSGGLRFNPSSHFISTYRLKIDSINLLGKKKTAPSTEEDDKYFGAKGFL